MKTLKNNNKTSKLETTLNKMLEMLMIIKIYHWKTNSYASHKATDQLYQRLNENMDKFVEIWLGKNGKKLNANMNITVKYLYNHKRLIKNVNLFIVHLMELKVDSDLQTVRDDIVGDLNQFIYLLSFK
jgi:DNA-binding ferritin-like protein